MSGSVTEASDVRPEATAVENPAFLPSPDVFPDVTFPSANATVDDRASRSRPAADVDRPSVQQLPPSTTTTASRRYTLSRKTSLAQLSAIDLDPLPTSGVASARLTSSRSSASVRCPADGKRVGDVSSVQPRSRSGTELDPDRSAGTGAMTTPQKAALRTTLV